MAGSSVFTVSMAVSQLAQSTPSSNRAQVMNTFTMGLMKTMPHRPIYRIYKREQARTLCGKKMYDLEGSQGTNRKYKLERLFSIVAKALLFHFPD